MAFREIDFPYDLAEGAQAGPGYNTRIVRTADGRELRIARWTAPVRRWSLPTGGKADGEIQRLHDFYLALGGAQHGFRFRDPLDFTTGEFHRGTPSWDEHEFGVGDGVTTSFQLRKNYKVLGPPDLEHRRAITKPRDTVAEPLRIGVDGVEVTSGWTVDTTTGVVTFATPPDEGDVLVWGGWFDTPARFTDESDEWLRGEFAEYEVASMTPSLVEIRDGTVDTPDLMYLGGAKVVVLSAANPLLAASTGVAKYYRLSNTNPTAGLSEVYLPDLATLPTGGPLFVFHVIAATQPIEILDDQSVAVGAAMAAGETAMFYAVEDDAGLRGWDRVDC